MRTINYKAAVCDFSDLVALMSQLPLDADDDMGFRQHAKAVFNRRFHAINTKYHSLALFLHPLCRKLAITQAASGRPIEFMIKVALDIAKQWNWDKIRAAKLITDIQTYHLSRAPFAGGTADGLTWWEHLTISSEDHPLKAFAITILSIVPHAGDIERLFSDLGNTQSPRRCNLSVSTFETLGKIRANLNYHIHTSKMANGEKTRRRHAHMHTRDQPGININVAKDLEERFTWVPPLLALKQSLWTNLMLCFPLLNKQSRARNLGVLAVEVWLRAVCTASMSWIELMKELHSKELMRWLKWLTTTGGTTEDGT
ncbi:hypothetical protein V8E55_008670 [Tylopilus felleus]